MTAPAADNNFALRVRDLSKVYRMYDRPFDRLKEMILRRPCHEVVHALHPLSFDVLRGQCVGVVGANGAGKTTLLSLLTGTLAPSTGSIEVYGRVSAILGLGIGMLPTHTGRENIRHGLITRGIPAERHAELEREILAFSELGPAIDHAVSTYSSGMAMRLNFSIAHAVEPDILIVDEALAVGDARFVFKCQKKMREFLDRGKTLFFVSHNLHTIEQICTSALLLDKGRLLHQGEVKDVLQQYRMLYFGQPVASDAPPQQSPAPKDAGPLEPDSPVNLISVDVLDGGYAGTNTWEMGQMQPLRLRVRLRTTVRIAQPALGVIIKAGYGNRITGASTVNAATPPPAIEPGEFELEYHMRSAFPAGTYQVEIIVADNAFESPRLLLQAPAAANLVVRWSDHKVTGLIDVGAEIQFAGTTYSLATSAAQKAAVAGALSA